MLQPISREFAEAPEAARSTPAVPTTGLFLLGLTGLLLSLYYTGYSPFSLTLLGVGMFYGALGLIATGLAAGKRHDAFGTVFGLAFGLFCLSLIAMIVMPEGGVGQAPQPPALSSYLAFWGLFTSILFTPASRFGREFLLFMVLLAVFLLLLAAGIAAESRLISAIAGGEGIVCSLVGMYAGAVGSRTPASDIRPGVAGDR